MRQSFHLILGEVKIAVIIPRESNDKWLASADTALPNHVISRNDYTREEAIAAVKMLLPEPCREYVREFNR